LTFLADRDMADEPLTDADVIIERNPLWAVCACDIEDAASETLHLGGLVEAPEEQDDNDDGDYGAANR
jgi:hypothetical protein